MLRPEYLAQKLMPSRPRGCRAAEQRDEIAPSHSITSSATAQGRWHGEVQHFGCGQIDDQIKFGRLLD